MSPDREGRSTVDPAVIDLAILDRRAVLARRDQDALASLIDDYRPFILSVASRTCHRSIDTDNDEEYSVALLAFYEAVRIFDPERGSFLNLARQVIQKRLVDFFRREHRHLQTLSYDEAGDDDDEFHADLTAPAAQAAFDRMMQAMERRAEVQRLRTDLEPRGIRFQDLSSSSPKALKTRRVCARAIRAILGTPALVRRVLETNHLPVSELDRRYGIPPKILERHRKYIVAAIVVLSGDYPYVAEYLSWVRTEGRSE